ncbi:MAG: type II toxin-antitoxin system HicA family toxin [Staphylothermus sp.]|nr:type II toxin-antitoxin system HicA family toxin [Staphylothermus sp.]
MKLPVVSGKDTIRALEKIGYIVVKIKGSHAKLKRGERVVIVPLHDEISKGTLLSIIRQAGITKEQFIELLKDP